MVPLAQSTARVYIRAVVWMMSSEPQNIVTKLGMVMQQNESVSCGTKIVCCLQGQSQCGLLRSKYDSDYNVEDQRVVVV